MTKNSKPSLIIVYKLLLSISIFITGICLIWGSLSIYYSGNGYSRQMVLETFSKICIPVYICLALLIGSFIINLFIKEDVKKPKFKKLKNFNQNTEPKLNNKTMLTIKIVVIIIGLISLVFGAIIGGFNDVLTKAVNICTECIGLG